MKALHKNMTWDLVNLLVGIKLIVENGSLIINIIVEGKVDKYKDQLQEKEYS